MKRIVFHLLLLFFMSLLMPTVNARENLNYTLENGVLTGYETEGFEGELILPSDEMGAVDKIIVEETAGSSGITALILTANDEIVIEKNAFFEHKNLNVLELTAKNMVKLCGEGWNWNDRFDFGCFESSGLEKVVIRTKELDMSEGWAFHECSSLIDFDTVAENYAIGENCFTDYYWNGTKYIFWLPWIENREEDFVYLGDTIIAYKGDANEITIPNGKLSIDMFNANGYNYDIKKIIMSDEITEIPENGFCTVLTFLGSLEQIKLPRGVTKIPSGCFGWNTNLKDVWISKTTTAIGGKVFPENCSATIHYEGTADEWNNIELLSKNADVNEALYQKYLDTLANMKLHFNCTNSELDKSKIISINIIEDSPYTIEVLLEGETNSGILFVALIENGYIKEVKTEKTDGYYQFGDTNLGDTIKVFWLENLESLKPLCEAKEITVPYVSNKKIMTVVKKAKDEGGYVIEGYTEGERVAITVDAQKEPIVEETLARSVIAYIPDGDTIKDIELIFSAPGRKFTPDKGASYIAEDTLETVCFGLAEYSTDSVIVNGVEYTVTDDTNYFMMKYTTGGVNKLKLGVGTYDEMKDNYVLIRVKANTPTVISDVVIFEGIN